MGNLVHSGSSKYSLRSLVTSKFCLCNVRDDFSRSYKSSLMCLLLSQDYYKHVIRPLRPGRSLYVNSLHRPLFSYIFNIFLQEKLFLLFLSDEYDLVVKRDYTFSQRSIKFNTVLRDLFYSECRKIRDIEVVERIFHSYNTLRRLFFFHTLSFV